MKHEIKEQFVNDIERSNKAAASKLSITDLSDARDLDREAMQDVVGGRAIQVTVDGVNPGTIDDFDMFVMWTEGKVTYK